MDKIRILSKTEAETGDEFHRGECQAYHGPRGGQREEIEAWRRNGATQLWKTRPEDFRVPVKWGMRSYGDITPANVGEFHLAKNCPLTLVEYRRVLPDGRIIEIQKWGGGTLGRKYAGDWYVVLCDRSGKLLFDDRLITGTPKTHAEVQEITLDFLNDEEG